MRKPILSLKRTAPEPASATSAVIQALLAPADKSASTAIGSSSPFPTSWPKDPVK